MFNQIVLQSHGLELEMIDCQNTNWMLESEKNGSCCTFRYSRFLNNVCRSNSIMLIKSWRYSVSHYSCKKDLPGVKIQLVQYAHSLPLHENISHFYLWKPLRFCTMYQGTNKTSHHRHRHSHHLCFCFLGFCWPALVFAIAMTTHWQWWLGNCTQLRRQTYNLGN